MSGEFLNLSEPQLPPERFTREMGIMLVPAAPGWAGNSVRWWKCRPWSGSSRKRSLHSHQRTSRVCPSSPTVSRSDKGQWGCELRGSGHCSPSLQDKAGGPTARLTPPVSLSLSGRLTQNQLCPHSPRSYPCTPTRHTSVCSLTCDDGPPHPRAHPAQLQRYKLSRNVSHTRSYTHPITQSCTVCMPHYTQFCRVSPTVTVARLLVPSRSRTHCLLHTHTAAPMAACSHKPLYPVSHTHGLTRGSPTLQLHAGDSRAHTHSHAHAHSFRNNIRHAISFA